MIGFIRRWLENRRRAIFWFRVDGHWRAIDPMIPYAIIMQHPKFVLEQTPQLIELGNLEAIATTAQAARDAFGIEPLDSQGHGLSQAECVQLLTEFICWMDDVKKKGSTSPISSAPTTSSPPPDFPTSKNSPSSSTSIASTVAEPSLP